MNGRLDGHALFGRRAHADAILAFWHRPKGIGIPHAEIVEGFVQYIAPNHAILRKESTPVKSEDTSRPGS